MVNGTFQNNASVSPSSAASGNSSGNSSACDYAYSDNQNDAGSGDFWIGVVAALVGSVTLNLGLNMQKLAFVRIEAMEPDTRPNVWMHPLWLAGLVVFLIGNAGDAVGLTFTAQSVITPLGQISLVSNIYFAWLLVGEKVDVATVLATIAVIVGVVLIVSASNSSCSDFTIVELLHRFGQPGFLIFAMCHVGSLVTLLMYARGKEKIMRTPVETLASPGKDEDSNGSSPIPRTAHITSLDETSRSVSSVANRLQKLSLQEQFSLRLAYPLIASLFAAWTVLLSKAVGELAKNAFRANTADSWQRFESWVILGFFLLSCPSQILYMQKGLQLFEAMYIIPIFSSCWLVGSIMMGALFWGDFVGFQIWQYFVFFIGVGLIVFGIVLLQRRGMGVSGGMQVAPAMTGSHIILKDVDQAVSGPGVLEPVVRRTASDSGKEHEEVDDEAKLQRTELGLSVLSDSASGSSMPSRPQSAPMRYKVAVQKP